MATAKVITVYAKNNNISRAEAKQHFINEAIKKAKTNKTVLNPQATIKAVGPLADMLIAQNPTVNYYAHSIDNDGMANFAKWFLEFNGIVAGIDNRNALMDAGEVLEKTIDSKYGTTLYTNFEGLDIGNFGRDLDEHMLVNGVPQHTRVVLGMLAQMVYETEPNKKVININTYATA
jgi:hypothetical protein